MFVPTTFRKAILFACLFGSTAAGAQDVTLTHETFPNGFNESFTRPLTATNFTQATGTWVGFGNDNRATVLCNTAHTLGSYSLKIYNEATSASNTNSFNRATSPVVNLSSAATYVSTKLSFQAYIMEMTNGSDDFTFKIEGTSNGSTWTTLGTYTANDLYDLNTGTGTGTDKWKKFELSIPSSLRTANFRYRFSGSNEASEPNAYLYIDEIKIIANPCGQQASQIPNFSGTPSFVSGSNNGSYDVNDVYRYANVVTSPFNMYADIKIEAISNATIVMFDNNAAGVTQRFQPQIGPSGTLNNDKEGYVQFSITFRKTSDGSLVSLSNQKFRHYDLDGFQSGTGYFQETGWVTGQSSVQFNTPSNLTDGGLITDGGYSWRKILGEKEEHTSVSSDPEVVFTANYASASIIRFRMGYKFIKGNGGNQSVDFREYAAEFGCFEPSSNIPLPLSLLNFTGTYRSGKAYLNWTTENELNVSRFEVERSVDGTLFSSIGTVTAAGRSRNEYSLADDLAGLSSSVIYYRLRSVDNDGKLVYSKVVFVKKDAKSINAFTIAPNPVKSGNATVVFGAAAKGLVRLTVVDPIGRTVFTQVENAYEGTNTFTLNGIEKLQSGTYLVQLQQGSEVLHTKLSIVR